MADLESPLETQESFFKFRSRKLYLAFFAMVACTALLVGGDIPPDIWKEVFLWSQFAYVGGNGFEKFVNKGKFTSPQQPPEGDGEA